MNRSAVLEAALALPENDRIHLVEVLLETFGPDTDGVEEASFNAELCRRSDEVDQGTAELVPWSELKEEPL
jgi:putative addiction module component (TIGR02574 family)